MARRAKAQTSAGERRNPHEEDAPFYRGGSGEPLVLLHPFAATWREWKPLLGALTAERDVLAPRLAGHYGGEPLPPGARPTVEVLADAVERDLDTAGFEAPDLVGNSLGARVALELARRGRARSVVAIGPAGGMSEAESLELARTLRKAHADLTRFHRTAMFLARFRAGRWLLFRDYSSRPGRVDVEEARYALTALTRCPAFSEVIETHWETPGGDMMSAEALGGIGCPVLIVHGSKDRITPPHQADHFVDHIPNARSIELAGLGHVPMSDDPELVARTILDFSRR